MGLLERDELNLLKQKGHLLNDPSDAITLFEEASAKYCGSSYAVAVDCATHALKLCLYYLKAQGPISIPKHTYPSVPMMARQMGLDIQWTSERWSGTYKLDPYPVVDSSLVFDRDCFIPQHFVCLSFQHKKRLPIGKGGMILTDDAQAYQWLKRAVHDGRTPGVFWHKDQITMEGWHYYLTPDDAARGLLLLEQLIDGTPDDRGGQLGGWENYPDLTTFPVFKMGEIS